MISGNENVQDSAIANQYIFQLMQTLQKKLTNYSKLKD